MVIFPRITQDFSSHHPSSFIYSILFSLASYDVFFLDDSCSLLLFYTSRQENAVTSVRYDFGGNDAALRSFLTRLITFSRGRKEFSRVGLPIPNVAVLFGPPGSGKSHLIDCVARHLALPVRQIDMRSITGNFVGDAEASVRFRALSLFLPLCYS